MGLFISELPYLGDFDQIKTDVMFLVILQLLMNYELSSPL